MKNYLRLMLGRKSVHADECYKGNFIGVDFGILIDLSNKLPDNWKEFNKEYIPIYLQQYPEKTKVAAGLACATIWVVSKFLKIGDVVLCPDGTGKYMVGEVQSEYSYHKDQILPHRRSVKWLPVRIERSSMTEAFQHSAGAIATYCDITKYSNEIESLIGDQRPASIISTDESIEDPSVFALEKHLEDFLVQNWKQTELGKQYDIYEIEGESVGQQFPSDNNTRMDILAISKDKKTLLVVELKKGRVSDQVVGQILRYMGFVKEEIAENNQTVKGMIIALDDDLRIKRALSMTDNIEFYRYQVNFKLFKG